MSKEHIISELARKLDKTKTESAKILKTVVDVFQETLVDSKEVRLVPFGTIYTKVRPARKARSPKTGASIDVKEKKVAGFRPGKGLKEALNP